MTGIKPSNGILPSKCFRSTTCWIRAAPVDEAGSTPVDRQNPGHANIAVTLDTYSHVAPGLQEAAAKRFDEAFTTGYNSDAENEDAKKSA
ncbi:MAG: hypothetical protein U9N44_03875 [Chloroflexota bacterium]|nr:hypothetical protein [Chloroflexota bacterium]